MGSPGSIKLTHKMNLNGRVEKGQVSAGTSQNQRRLKEKAPEAATKGNFKKKAWTILGER